MNRRIEALSNEEFDLLVVGGGITGACIAWDAALRGLEVALVERDDFGGGVSANCLKIVHGGLRHLQKLDLPRMRESIVERSFWLRAAPHLVEPLPFLMPTHRGGQHPRALLRVAMALNDLVSLDRNRGLVEGRTIPPGRTVSRRECVELVPEADSPTLTGGVLFHDGLMYSAERLVLEVVMAAVAVGAEAANHAAFEAPLHRAGRVVGGIVRDRLSGDRLEVRARVTVNATGRSTELLPRGPGGEGDDGDDATARRSLALNLVTRQPAPRVAWTAQGPAREGGRQLLFVPWRGHLMIGTGHYPHRGGPEPGPVDGLASRFLAAANSVRPSDAVPEDSVCLVHAGLLPAPSGPREPVRFLRRHRIVRHAEGGAFTVQTPKYTTARRVAQDTVDRVFREMELSPPPSQTATARLEGAPDSSPAALLADARRRWEGVVEPDVLEHLVRSYGRRYDEVLGLRSVLRGWDRRVVPSAPVVTAQLAHGVQREMAVLPEDLVWRRTELGPRGLASREVLQAATDAFDVPVPDPALPAGSRR